MGHHKRRERSVFLTGKEIEAMYFDEFEAEFSKNCATEFDKRLIYVFKAPEILEKAWEMPWGWGKKEDFARNWFYIPQLFGEYERVELLERTYADTALIFTENNGEKCLDDCFKEAFESNKAEMTWNLRNKTYCPKDWRDCK